MPCYRCGTRQVDPDRGESPWKRGVRGDRQVLICPGCQVAFDWMADLDRCPVCAGISLLRRLGEVECRGCGSVGQPVGATAAPASPSAVVGLAPAGTAGAGPAAGPGADPRSSPGNDTGPDAVAGYGGELDAGVAPGLAEEVEQALARVLGRARRTAGIG